MDFAPSARSDELKAKLVEFDQEVVRPAEPIYRGQREDSGDPHFAPPVMEELKVEARKRDLWNLFLPNGYDGRPGLSNLDYAPLCEVMGTHSVAAGTVVAAAARRRDPLVLRDDRAVGCIFGRDQHLVAHRA
jgi:acyl-CoA dehydrogenase